MIYGRLRFRLRVAFLRCVVALACISAPVFLRSQPSPAVDSVQGRACATCHAAAVSDSIDHPHAGQSQPHSATAITCSSCHGDGAKHVESRGDKAFIFTPSVASPKQANAMCLDCHKGKHPAYETSVHGKAGISCIDCHRIHTPTSLTSELKSAQPDLCFSCHTSVKADFVLPSHHKVNEGLVRCADCHDPHDPTGDTHKSAAAQSAVCTNCHTDVAGPFKFDHGAVKSEGCTACHSAHGSRNPHLLTRSDVDAICRVCHMPAPNAETGLHGVFPGEQPVPSQTCTTCHAMVHGSNTSPALLQKAPASGHE